MSKLIVIFRKFRDTDDIYPLVSSPSFREYLWKIPPRGKVFLHCSLLMTNVHGFYEVQNLSNQLSDWSSNRRIIQPCSCFRWTCEKGNEIKQLWKFFQRWWSYGIRNWHPKPICLNRISTYTYILNFYCSF